MADTIGRIGWIDMSVDDAEQVRDFYKAVVRWNHEDVSMGEYADYSMTTPRRILAVFATWIGLCLASVPPALAQLVLEGQVLDDVTLEPIAHARVLLLTRYDKVAGYATTDEAGRFRFEKDAGWYRMNVRAVGYQETETSLLWMLDRGYAGLEIRLSPTAVLLAPVEIVALRVPATSAVFDNLLQRRMSGLSQQVTREEIEARRPVTITDMLMEIPGVFASGGGTGSTRHIRFARATAGPGGGDCPVQVFLDGTLMTRDVPGGDIPIDDLVHPLDVEAIEIFKGLSSIPPEFLTPNARCGVIAIWTRRSLP